MSRSWPLVSANVQRTHLHPGRAWLSGLSISFGLAPASSLLNASQISGASRDWLPTGDREVRGVRVRAGTTFTLIRILTQEQRQAASWPRLSVVPIPPWVHVLRLVHHADPLEELKVKSHGRTPLISKLAPGDHTTM